MGTHRGAHGRDGTEPFRLMRGEYARFQGCWHGRTPSGLLVNLSKLEPVVHDDGELSVTSPIHVESGHLSWRGRLDHGVWVETP